MRPPHKKVVGARKAGRLLEPAQKPRVAQVHVALKLVALGVVANARNAPAASGVNVAKNGQIHVIANAQVVAALRKVKAQLRRFAIGRQHNAAVALLLVGEKAKGHRQRGRNVGHLEVSRAGNDFVVLNHLQLGSLNVKVRIIGIAGGVLAVLDVNDVVRHLFYLLAVNVAFALLHHRFRNFTLLRGEVVAHGIGGKFLLAIVEFGPPNLLSGTVRFAKCGEHVVLQIQLNVFGLQPNLVVLYLRIAKQVKFLLHQVKFHRVGRQVFNFGIEFAFILLNHGRIGRN